MLKARVDRALCMLDEMLDKGYESTFSTFSLLIDGMYTAGRLLEAYSLFHVL